MADSGGGPRAVSWAFTTWELWDPVKTASTSAAWGLPSESRPEPCAVGA
jgi:hypothetical protein